MESLGIDYKLFIGQIVNFLILLLILWRFAYKPIVKMLNDRRQKIAESIQNSKTIEEKLAATEEKTAELISSAQAEAAKMIDNAKKLAEEQKKEIVALAKSQAEKEKAQAKEAIINEKNLATTSLQKEMTRLVGLATAKILAETPNQALQEKAIEEAIEKIKNKT